MFFSCKAGAGIVKRLALTAILLLLAPVAGNAADIFTSSGVKVSAASGIANCVVAELGIGHGLTAVLFKHPELPDPMWFVNVGTGSDLYPGAPAYLNVDGQRYRTASVSTPGTFDPEPSREVMKVLRTGREFWVEWKLWPSGLKGEGHGSLMGFSSAATLCEREIAAVK